MKIENMKTGQKAIELIKRYEGIHDGDLTQIGLQPKLCPADIWTVGYGRALRDTDGSFLRSDKSLEYVNSIHPKAATISKNTAEEWLKEDLEKYEDIVKRKLAVILKQWEFDALVSHTYNTGGSTTLFRLINERSIAEINDWWTTRYITAGGIELRGLVLRRASEWELYYSDKLS